MSDDPLFGLFTIPDSAESVPLFKAHLERSPGAIAFRERTRRLGVYPVCYRPHQAGGEGDHVHEFLELFLVLSGASEHVCGGRVAAVRPGELVLVGHGLPHRFRGYSPDFEVLNLCFLPSALGYSDSLLRDRTTFDYYALLVPFSPSDPSPLHLRPDPRTFRKLAFLAFLLLERFYLEQGGEGETMARGGPEPLRDALRLFLGLVANEARGAGLAGPGAPLLKDVLELLQLRFRERLTLSALAARFHMAPTTFSTRFNRGTGRTLPRYLNELRCAEAERLLRQTTLPVRRIADEVGYENASHFSTVFKRVRGHTPQEVRARGFAPG